MRRFGPNSAADDNKLTDDSIEAFFIHKLSLLLDQKSEALWKKEKVMQRVELSKQKSEVVETGESGDALQAIASHDLGAFGSSTLFMPEFPSDTLLDADYSVRVENFGSTTETLDVALKTL